MSLLVRSWPAREFDDRIRARCKLDANIVVSEPTVNRLNDDYTDSKELLDSNCRAMFQRGAWKYVLIG